MPPSVNRRCSSPGVVSGQWRRIDTTQLAGFAPQTELSKNISMVVATVVLTNPQRAAAKDGPVLAPTPSIWPGNTERSLVEDIVFMTASFRMSRWFAQFMRRCERFG